MLAPQPQPVVRNQIVDSIEAAASLKEILSIACGAVRAGLQEGGAMRAHRIKRGFFRLGIGLAMLCALLAFFNLFASTRRAARNGDGRRAHAHSDAAPASRDIDRESGQRRARVQRARRRESTDLAAACGVRETRSISRYGYRWCGSIERHSGRCGNVEACHRQHSRRVRMRHTP